MTPEQTYEDVDELEERAEQIEAGSTVRLEWYSRRSSGTVSIEGETLEHEQALLYVRTPERKSDIAIRRLWPEEIRVSAISRTTNRQPTIGWLTDVEEVDDAE